MAFSPKEIEMMKYYQKNGQLHPDTQLDAEGAFIVPGLGLANAASKGGGIMNWLSKLVGNNKVPYINAASKYGSKAKGNIDAINIGKNMNTTRKAGNKALGDLAKKNLRLRANNERKLVNQIAKTNRARKQGATGLGAVGLTAALQDLGTRKQGEGTIGPSNTGISNQDTYISPESISQQINSTVVPESQLREVVQDPNVFSSFLDTTAGREALIGENDTLRGGIQMGGDRGKGYNTYGTVDSDPRKPYNHIPTFLTDIVPSSGVQKEYIDKINTPGGLSSPEDIAKLNAIINTVSNSQGKKKLPKGNSIVTNEVGAQAVKDQRAKEIAADRAFNKLQHQRNLALLNPENWDDGSGPEFGVDY